MRIDSEPEISDFIGPSEAGGAAKVVPGAGPEAADTKLTNGAETGNNRPGARLRKGISGNPRGRPAGRRNEASLRREARLAERIDRELDGLVDALLGKALSGHVGAIRTVLALSLSHRRLDLPGLAGEAADETDGEALPNPVLSAKNSSRAEAPAAPGPTAADIAFPVLSARIQPAPACPDPRPDPDLVVRRITLDAPPGAGTGPLAGLVAIDPSPEWAPEPRSYLVAAPPGTAPDLLAAFLSSLGIELGPDDRILRAGHAPRPMLVLATPPLRIAAAGEGSPP